MVRFGGTPKPAREMRALSMSNSGIKKSELENSLACQAIALEQDRKTIARQTFVSLRSKRRLGLTGLEPVTLRLSSACSNQLSYRPVVPAKRHLRSKIERRRARIPLI